VEVARALAWSPDYGAIATFAGATMKNTSDSSGWIRTTDLTIMSRAL
jgi:hypothetical protein